MNSKIELILTGGLPYTYSGNTNSTAAGVVDLYEDEPIQLNISVADIKDITRSKSTYSQNFVVPGTANNNTLFNFIFEIGSDSQFFPNKKTPCQLLVDTIPVMTTGSLQLTSIAIDDDKNISYQVIIFDEAKDLIDSLGSLLLTDLDYTDLNHIWKYENIVNSWTGTSQPYFYPLIDYGYDLSITGVIPLTANTANINTLSVNQMYPATQVKTIWDRIFSQTGYTYTSQFLNSEYFENLYLPCTEVVNAALDPKFINNLRFFAELGNSLSNSYIINPDDANYIGDTITKYSLDCNNTSVYPGFDYGNNYNTSTLKYTSPATTVQTFNVNLVYELTYSGIDTLPAPPTQFIFPTIFVNFYRSTYSNTIPYETIPVDIGDDYYFTVIFDTPAVASFQGTSLNQSSGKYQPAQSGETFWVDYMFKMSYNTTDPLDVTPLTGYTFTLNLLPSAIINSQNQYSGFFNIPSATLTQGTLIPYVSLIPQNIKQIDFINSIMTMHNLYVIPDINNEKNFIIEPRDNYYKSGITKDWSSKLDLTTPVQEQLLSEQQNNRIIFSYKSDNDYYNTNYQTNTNRIFGDYYAYISNDFTKDDQNINIIFSPTENVNVQGTQVIPITLSDGSTELANDFVIPYIVALQSTNSDNQSNNWNSTSFNIRILQKNPNNLLPLSNSEVWYLTNDIGVPIIQNSYPYIGMLNHPYSATTDIGFGSVLYEYYILPEITPNNLVNTYYAKQLNQIIDKNAKLITANLYLTPADIQSFRFNDIIFMDGLSNSSMGDYFTVNSITYSPSVNAPSQVELIQVIDENVEKVYKVIPNIKTNPLNIVKIGNNQILSGFNLAIGLSNIIRFNVLATSIFGNLNQVGDGSESVSITGNNSIIGNVNKNILSIGNTNITGIFNTNTSIIGNNNTTNDFNTNTTIFGNNNTITSSGLTGVSIFGNNISATTSNTLYANNIELSSGGTINGIPISSFISGATDILWTSGSSGNYSVKLINGSGLDATAPYAFAIGSATTASGSGSYAEGTNTIASGQTSHAEGSSTIAGGQYSHAEGWFSTASGQASHAEGASIASGSFSHAESSGIATGNASHAEGGGQANGVLSHAEGTGIASGLGSHAEGYGGCIASAQASHAEGQQTIASGTSSHSEGQQTIASGTSSHSEGNLTTAGGAQSHAEGNRTTAFGGFGSHAEGSTTKASGQSSHAEGNTTFAIGNNSHAEGSATTASGAQSHVEGTSSTASGLNSHAEGNATLASVANSHAEGDTTTASADGAHSEGLNTTASGDGSHAGGYLSIASGNTSFVHGSGSTANGSGTIVLGNNITGNTDNTVYVSNLNIGTLGLQTCVNVLGIDTNNNVVPALNLQYIVGFNELTGLTTSNSGITVYTPSSLGTYTVGGRVTITAISINNLTFNVSWTDETNTFRTMSFFPEGLTSAALATTGAFAFPAVDIRASAGNPITLYTTATGIGSQTYNAGGKIMHNGY